MGTIIKTYHGLMNGEIVDINVASTLEAYMISSRITKLYYSMDDAEMDTNGIARKDATIFCNTYYNSTIADKLKALGFKNPIAVPSYNTSTTPKDIIIYFPNKRKIIVYHSGSNTTYPIFTYINGNRSLRVARVGELGTMNSLAIGLLSGDITTMRYLDENGTEHIAKAITAPSFSIYSGATYTFDLGYTSVDERYTPYIDFDSFDTSKIPGVLHCFPSSILTTINNTSSSVSSQVKCTKTRHKVYQ